MAKPSILFINRTYPPVRNTSGRLLHDLAHDLDQAGWQVTILTTQLKKTVHDRAGNIKLIKIAAPENRGNIISGSWIWLKLFMAGCMMPKPDLLVTMTDPPMLVVAGHLLSKFKKIPHIHWCQELYPDIFPALDIRLPGFMMQPLKSLSRRAMNGCEKIIVPGRCMARHLLRSGVARQKISVIYNWADLLIKKPQEDTPPSISLTPENNIPHGTKTAFPSDDTPKFRIMHTGHIKKFHTLNTILEAARLLDSEHPDIEFVFVGTGAPFDRLAEERARLGLHNIRLMPFQPTEQVETVMKMGDVHLLSLRENATGFAMPRRLHTAFAAERPCIFIGSSSCDAAQLIREYHAGYNVKPGDAKDLAAQIRHLRLNGDDWFAAQKGASAAAKAMTAEKSMRNWLTAVNQTLAPYKKPDAKI